MPEREDERSRPAALTFLTREGCVQTAELLANLRAAVERSGATVDVVDVGTVPSDDVRTAYGTPTILRGGNDLFGLAKPQHGTRAPT